MATLNHPAWTSSALVADSDAQELEPGLAREAFLRGGWLVTHHERTQAGGELVAWSIEGLWSEDVLTAEDLRVAARRAEGEALKVIAFDLGRSIARVGHELANAERKLRLRSSAELVSFFAAWRFGIRCRSSRWSDSRRLLVNYTTPRGSLPPCLSAAEQRVVRALFADASHTAVARACGIAPRTVANHLASVYRKTGVGSHLELLAALSRRAWLEHGATE